MKILLDELGWLLPAASLIPLLLLLFPDGRLLSPHWRWAVWAVALGGTLGTLNVAWLTWPLRGAALLSYLERGSDIPFEGGVISQVLSIISALLLLGSLITSIIAIALRFRCSRGVERQQLKWFTYAIALAACIQVVVIGRGLIYGDNPEDLFNLALIVCRRSPSSGLPFP